MPLKNNRPEYIGDPLCTPAVTAGEEKQLPVEQIRVVGRVVRPVHQQQLAIDTEDRCLGNVAAEDLGIAKYFRKTRRYRICTWQMGHMCVPRPATLIFSIIVSGWRGQPRPSRRNARAKSM